jgi:hypothetical protein
VLGAKRPLANGERASCEWLAARVATTRVLEAAQIMVDAGDLRVFRTIVPRDDRQSAAIERLGLGVACHVLVEHPQPVQDGGDGDRVGAERTLGALERPAQQWLGTPIAPSVVVTLCQPFEPPNVLSSSRAAS